MSYVHCWSEVYYTTSIETLSVAGRAWTWASGRGTGGAAVAATASDGGGRMLACACDTVLDIQL